MLLKAVQCHLPPHFSTEPAFKFWLELFQVRLCLQLRIMLPCMLYCFPFRKKTWSIALTLHPNVNGARFFGSSSLANNCDKCLLLLHGYSTTPLNMSLNIIIKKARKEKRKPLACINAITKPANEANKYV